MSARLILMSAAGGSDMAKYWVSTLGAAGSNAYAGKIAIDSTGNCYAVGAVQGGNAYKFSPDGALLWRTNLLVADVSGITVDSSGNCYVCGGYNDDAYLWKLNSSGVLQWQKRIYKNAGLTDAGYALTVDSSNNVYFTGYFNNAYLLIMKFDSSGTILLQRYFATTAKSIGYGIALDTSGNIYTVGEANNGSARDGFISKYNSSGTLQWQRTITNSIYNAEYRGIAVDSSGNCYVAGTTYTYGFFVKYDTNGTLQWQRRFSNNSSAYGIGVDSSSNCYVVGSYTESNGEACIVKCDTDGNVQWQNRLYTTAGGDGAVSIAVSASGDCYFAGNFYDSTSTVQDIFVCKVKGDGTGAGTYGQLTYGTATNLTVSSVSYTGATSTYGEGASSMNMTAGVVTVCMGYAYYTIV